MHDSFSYVADGLSGRNHVYFRGPYSPFLTPVSHTCNNVSPMCNEQQERQISQMNDTSVVAADFEAVLYIK